MSEYSNTITVSQAVDNWSKKQKCEKTTWEQVKLENGEENVIFTCNISRDYFNPSTINNSMPLEEAIKMRYNAQKYANSLGWTRASKHMIEPDKKLNESIISEMKNIKIELLFALSADKKTFSYKDTIKTLYVNDKEYVFTDSGIYKIYDVKEMFTVEGGPSYVLLRADNR